MKVPKSNLIVKSVDPKQKFHHPPPAFKHLPQHPFSMIMVAPPGSGKTNLLCWMILKLYKGFFHRIVVCSTTLDNDEKWNQVKKEKHLLGKNKKLEHILDGLAKSKHNKKWKLIHANEKEQAKNQLKDEQGENDDGQIDEDDMFMDINRIFPILEEQQEMVKFLKEYLKEEKKDEDQAIYLADRLLVILDDQAGKFDNGTNTPLNNFVIRHRHFSASIIIVTQAYKAIPRTIRLSCLQLVLFDIGSQNELKGIYEDRGGTLDEKTWLEVYKYAVKDRPYSFLYFNNKFDDGKRYYKRFESMIKVAPSALGNLIELPKKSCPEEEEHEQTTTTTSKRHRDGSPKSP